VNWYEDPAELKKRRKEAGLSSRELAERAGCSHMILRHIEAGRTKLRGKTADALWAAIARVANLREKREARTLTRLEPAPQRPSDLANLLADFKDKYAGAYDTRAKIEALEKEVNGLRTELAEALISIRQVVAKLNAAAARDGAAALAKNGVLDGVPEEK